MSGLKGARALVTGATGFLGQHVCAALSAAGVEPIRTSRSLGVDLTNEAQAMAAILVARPDIVVHLASPPAGMVFTAAVQEPLRMGLNVINACALAGAKLIMVGRGWPGAHAAVQEALLWVARASLKQHALKFVQIVPCDLYGPLDHPGLQRLVPYVLDVLVGGKDLSAKEVRLQGSPKRPFPLLHVEDAAKAVVMACELPGCDEPLRLSPSKTLQLEEISAIAAEHADFKGTVVWDGDQDPWYATPQDGDVAREVLGWEPVVDVENGLEATVRWLMSGRAVKDSVPEPAGKKAR